MSLGTKNVSLIGFMGTGKSSIGKALGRILSRPVVDIDHVIEAKERKKIREIFEISGEPHFRALERKAIAEASASAGAVITTGGGAAIDPENMRVLRLNGWVVALTAKPETIFYRVKDSKHRPLLKPGEDMLESIQKLMEIRAPYYEKADFRFDTDGRSASQVAEAIIRTLETQ
jgi:shikimate kinase